jgi:hypothetical protein
LLAAGFGIFWISMAGNIGAPVPFILFGMIFIGVAVFSAINGASKATAHSTAERDYLGRRRRLLAELRQAEASNRPARQ